MAGITEHNKHIISNYQ